VRIRRRWRSLTTRTLSSSSRRSVCDHAFADRIRPGCSGRTGQDPDAISGEDRIERPAEPGVLVPEQEREGGGVIGKVHQQSAGGLGGPRTGRVRGHAEQVCLAGAVLDRDQRVDPPENHGVHRDEVHGQYGLGLGGEELPPGRARPARCGINASVAGGSATRGRRRCGGRGGPVRPARAGVPSSGFRWPCG